VGTTFAATPDGLERPALERLVREYLTTCPGGEGSLLRLATRRDVDSLYGVVSSILDTIGAPEGGPDIELVWGDLLECTAPGDVVVTADATVAERVGARGRLPAQGFARRPGGTAVEQLRDLLGWVSIVWAAMVRGTSGYSDEARMFLRALDEAGLEPVIAQVRHDGKRAELSLATEQMLRRAERRRIPESSSLNVLHFMPLGKTPAPDVHVCRTMFETESIPDGWAEWLAPLRRVWVPTQFNVESFVRGGVDPEKLRILPGTIDFDRFHPGAEPYDLGERRDFTFVSNFDFQDRKGWDVLLRAYALEFAGEEDVTLALKVNTIHAPLHTIEARVAAELSRLGVPESQLPHIRVFDDVISEAGLPGFYTAADAYVSPTRGEGWGRPLMEAVACGAPVVASRWSAHLAFLNDDNATLVDGRVVDVPADVDIAVFRGMRWFDPDVDALRAALRAVRRDPAGARARAVGSRPWLVREFALPAIAERTAELALEAL
jgi:glycosyltransferase involved in cell wall biosynthesis